MGCPLAGIGAAQEEESVRGETRRAVPGSSPHTLHSTRAGGRNDAAGEVTNAGSRASSPRDHGAQLNSHLAAELRTKDASYFQTHAQRVEAADRSALVRSLQEGEGGRDAAVRG